MLVAPLLARPDPLGSPERCELIATGPCLGDLLVPLTESCWPCSLESASAIDSRIAVCSADLWLTLLTDSIGSLLVGSSRTSAQALWAVDVVEESEDDAMAPSVGQRGPLVCGAACRCR